MRAVTRMVSATERRPSNLPYNLVGNRSLKMESPGMLGSRECSENTRCDLIERSDIDS